MEAMPYLGIEKVQTGLGKQCGLISDAAEYSVWSRATLLEPYPAVSRHINR